MSRIRLSDFTVVNPNDRLHIVLRLQCDRKTYYANQLHELTGSRLRGASDAVDNGGALHLRTWRRLLLELLAQAMQLGQDLIHARR